MELPKPFINFERKPQNEVEENLVKLAKKINEILRYLEEREKQENWHKQFLSGVEALKEHYDSQEPPKEKEGYFMGIDLVCDVCKEHYCKCPERQSDGSWSKTTIEEVLKEFDERFPSTPNMKLDLNVWHKNTGEVQTHRQDMHDFLRTILTTQQEELTNKAWEYVVKAIREECGSKDEFIKFLSPIQD